MGRSKPCPYCAGRGSVSAERDTVRMTREEVEAMREESETLKTPKLPPPPAHFNLPLMPRLPSFEEVTPITAPINVRRGHDLPAIFVALAVTTVFLWGLAFVFFPN